MFVYLCVNNHFMCVPLPNIWWVCRIISGAKFLEIIIWPVESCPHLNREAPLYNNYVTVFGKIQCWFEISCVWQRFCMLELLDVSHAYPTMSHKGLQHSMVIVALFIFRICCDQKTQSLVISIYLVCRAAMYRFCFIKLLNIDSPL